MSPREPASFELLVRRRRWVASTLAALPALGGVSYFVWRSFAFGNAGLSMQFAIFGALLSFGVFRQLGGRYEMMTVRADERGLRIGRRWVGRSRIRSVLSGPGPAPNVLVKLRLLPTIELQTGSEAEARALGGALRLDASEHEVVFVGLSRLLSRPAFLAAAMLTVGATSASFHYLAPNLAPFVAPAVFAVVIVALFLPTRVAIGPNGIAVRWLGTRAAAWSEVEDVGREDWSAGSMTVSGLRVALRGTALLLPIALRLRGSMAPPGKLALVEERARQAMQGRS